MQSTHPPMPPIAVVGVGALAPGAGSVPDLWRTVLAGTDMITDVPTDHWAVADYYDPDPAAPDRTYGRRGAFLDPVDFDPTAYGIPPTAVPATDTSQLLALLVADQVLADAGLTGQDGAGRERAGVVLGTAALELLHTMSNRMQRPVWLSALRDGGISQPQAEQLCDRIAARYVPWQEATFPGLLSNVVAGRIANRFDLHGTNYTTDAACAGSLAAVSCAMSELALGTSDLMITGGVDTLNDIVMYMCFSKTPALSSTGDCRPFSAEADGTMLGEALVMFALKRLADAERDGDRIYAVIRGIGSSSDGRGQVIYAPVPAGQARALRRAYQAAGYGPDTVELVEAHGTGTVAGDAAEFSALRAVFGESGHADPQWCALGSIKSQIGHTKSAAGAAGLLKAVLALHHKILPPTIKIDQPNPALDLATSPFYLNTLARPWIRGADHPRRASVSSFGFGGTNFHLTAEEYRPSGSGIIAPWTRAVPTELVLLSAGSPTELAESADRLACADGPLADLARLSQQDFDPAAPARACLVVQDEADLATQLDRLRQRPPDAAVVLPDGMCVDPRPAAPGRVAFLFPGQGSQYVGMGADLAMYRPEAREVWDRAAEIPMGNRPLHRVVFPEPTFTAGERDAQAVLLTRTEWAQPALAGQSLAVMEVLRGLGVTPDCVAGHSFGELVALQVAGAFDETTLFQVARRRGDLMNELSTKPGAMLAVGGSCDPARLLDGYDGRVWIANHNSPTQVVLSGEADAITELETQLTSKGMTVRRLAASGAFHTPLFDEARATFADFLEEVTITVPVRDVYANADAGLYPADPSRIRRRLAEHLVTPVRFADQIEAMYAAGVRTFVEVGAGAVLCRMVSEVLGTRTHLAVSLDHKGGHGVTALHRGLGRLAVAGVPMRLDALWQPYAPPSPPRKPGRMSFLLSGNNYGRPDPAAPDTPDPAGGSTPAELSPATQLTPPVSTIPPGYPIPACTVAPPATDGHAVAARPAGAVVLHGGAEQVTTGSWLHAFEETQRQLAAAHTEYQRLMADSHQAFLQGSQATLAGLVDLASAGTVAPRAGTSAHHRSADVVPQPTALVPPTTVVPVDSPALVPNAGVPQAPDVTGAGQPTVSASAAADVGELLFGIVAERTGYPRDILEPHMELEADLGIDSIKRVEILALVRRRAPHVPEVPPEDLARLRTLGQIVDRFRTASPARPSAPDTGPAGIPQPSPAPVRTGAGSAAAHWAPDGAPSPGSATLTRSVTELVAVAAPGLELPGLRKGPILVVDDGSGVAAPLTQRLREHGIDATITPNGPAAALILLGGLRSLESTEAAIEVNTWAFRTVRDSAPALSENGLLVVVQDTGGDFGLGGALNGRAWSGGLAALARTAAREWPTAIVKAVDCHRGERTTAEVVNALAAELLTGGAATDVGLGADGVRRHLRDRPEQATNGSAPHIHPGSVIVVTGGGRGVTAASVTALAAAHRPALVLLGRTELADEPPGLPATADARELKRLLAARPPDVAGGPRPGPAEIGAWASRILAVREVRANLAALEAAGSTVRYFPVDIRDAAAVGAVLDRVRAELGPVTGVVHAAGVLADARLTDKTDEQFDAVFMTKVTGLHAVLTATAHDPLELLCVFSSVAGRFGNGGQADYAMANEVITQAAGAVATRRPGCAVRAIAWGPWDGGMVGPELRGRFRSTGIGLIPVDAGAAAFVRELESGPGPVRVTMVAGDHPDVLGSSTGRRPLGEALVRDAAYPYLSDHVVAGQPVIPMALVVEWFAGALRVTTDAADVLRDLQVVRGVSLPDFTGEGHLATVHATAGPPGPVGLELESGGQTHYRATAGSRSNRPPRDWVSDPAEPAALVEVYGGALFHGPAFQCLTEVTNLGATGAAAFAQGVREMGWDPGGAWHTDPAALDAALQLALLWAEHRFGAAFLPMGAEEIRLPGNGPVAQPARCVVLAREEDADPTCPRCDVAVLDALGRTWVEVFGVNLVRRPDVAGNGG